MLELNKQYEARFLGCQVLTRAVTGELLSRLVHALPEVVQSGLRCTVLCSAAGLTVTRQGNAATSSGSDNLVTLKVALRDILFCHVDKVRPEVTVWVVRNRNQTRDDVELSSLPAAASSSGRGESDAVLHAYIYRCSSANDALGLFKVYNEMSRQSRLDKYRRNGEKREVELSSVTSSGSDTSLDHSVQQRSGYRLQSIDDDVTSSSECSSDSGSSSSGSAGAGGGGGIGVRDHHVNASPTAAANPSVTVISNGGAAASGKVVPALPTRTVKVTSVATSTNNPKIAAKLWGQPHKPQPDLRNTLVVTGISSANGGQHSGNDTQHAGGTSSSRAPVTTNRNGAVSSHNQRPDKTSVNSPGNWAAIVGGIEQYRRSFSTLRPRDKEVRAAMLAELREKLKSRHHDVLHSDTSSGNDPSSPLGTTPSPTNNVASGSSNKQLASNRQRKPAKTIVNTTDTLQRERNKAHIQSNNFRSPAAPLQTPNRAFPFPFSMGNMVKKLVHKNKHHYSGGYVIGSVGQPQHPGGPTVLTPMLVLPMKGHHHQHNHLGVTMPLTNNNSNNGNHHQTPSRKFKAKKGPAPPPPIPALIKSRMATNGDSFFYLPPIASAGNGSASSGGSDGGNGNPSGAIVNTRNEVFVPVLPPAWVHHNHLHFHHHLNNKSPSSGTKPGDGAPSIDNGGPPSGKSKNRSKALAITNGGEGGKRAAGGNHTHHPVNKKKAHASIYGGLSRFARGYKKRSPPPPPMLSAGHHLVRSSSNASRGSTSSESGAEGGGGGGGIGGKLRSVMKKPRPTNDTSPAEQKKNVTFNAYATVQVLQ